MNRLQRRYFMQGIESTTAVLLSLNIFQLLTSVFGENASPFPVVLFCILAFILILVKALYVQFPSYSSVSMLAGSLFMGALLGYLTR